MCLSVCLSVCLCLCLSSLAARGELDKERCGEIWDDLGPVQTSTYRGVLFLNLHGTTRFITESIVLVLRI